MGSSLQLCNKGGNSEGQVPYDITTQAGAVSYFISFIVFMFGSFILLARTIYLLFVNPMIRNSIFLILLHISFFCAIILRSLYFSGGIEPFCYPNGFYWFVADFPSGCQTFGILMIICRFVESISYLSIDKLRQSMLKKLIYGLIGGGALELVILLIFILASISRPRYIILAIVQVCVLVLFVYFSREFGIRLTEYYKGYDLSKSKILVILIIVVLFVRIILAILNLTPALKGLGESAFIMLIPMVCIFDLFPVVLILFLSYFQERESSKKEQTRGDELKKLESPAAVSEKPLLG